MEHHSQICILLNFLIVISGVCNALSCSSPPKVIRVDNSNQKGHFKTIQSAIESIPEGNRQWVHIQIPSGTYKEKILISQKRSCIYLEGGGSSSTFIQRSDRGKMNTTSTFTSFANDLVVKGITFENTYNNPPGIAIMQKEDMVPALAAEIYGDRVAFYNCSFKGVQDTLWDYKGRHYFRHCFIQGAIDFIFGDAQSLYEKSTIYYTMGENASPGRYGTITAQKRQSNNSPTGFVFNQCKITGNGMAQLGRAYGPFSRVIITNSYLDHVVRPEGWGAWDQKGHVGTLTYVEEGNRGPGADKSRRVHWMKHMEGDDINKFISTSFLDKEGWINQQFKILSL